ncbi:MAG: ribonuclease III [Chlorobiaceae bacterium]|nr:ribonuclease III [Chlorobiaceae bacterium]NTW10712.1 ribonuclease III [Chlorobiaceae bacterium]
MERIWQKFPFLAFHRDKGGNNAPDTFDSSHPLSAAGLSPDTITFIRNLCLEKDNGIGLYLTALTHRSVVHDPATQELIESNQRLEFLGDSVLGLLISEYLFRNFPESAEGELSSNRSKIVNRKSLAGFARSMRLGDYLLIGESADRQKIRNSESALADAFESLIGAIYIDKGIQGAKDFIMKHVVQHIAFNAIVSSEHNYKSRLIEYTQSHHLPAPLYTVLQENGAEHEKTFTVAVYCSEQLLGQGTAARKKDAEQLAAKEAMERFAAEDDTPAS